jgi:hypothetical protein
MQSLWISPVDKSTILADLDQVIHRYCSIDNLWISPVDNSVDKAVDKSLQKVIPNLSTDNPQVYPHDKTLINKIKSGLSTEKHPPNNNKFKFINLKFMVKLMKNCG